MIPDLGKYAGTVLGAYGITLVLLAAIIATSWHRSSRARRDLRRLETSRRHPNE
jgi:heme exporter protein D